MTWISNAHIVAVLNTTVRILSWYRLLDSMDIEYIIDVLQQSAVQCVEPQKEQGSNIRNAAHGGDKFCHKQSKRAKKASQDKCF